MLWLAESGVFAEYAHLALDQLNFCGRVATLIIDFFPYAMHYELMIKINKRFVR